VWVLPRTKRVHKRCTHQTNRSYIGLNTPRSAMMDINYLSHQMEKATSFLTLSYAPILFRIFMSFFSMIVYYVPKVINTACFPSEIQQV
jgi:hypothetical protein